MAHVEHKRGNEGQAPEVTPQSQMASVKVGDTIRYLDYGSIKTGQVTMVGKSGIVFIGSRFLFPESIIRQ